MVSRWEKDLTCIVASTVHITQYNDGDNFPFQLVCPQNDKITWTCGEDEDGKITSVYSFRGSVDENPDRRVKYLPDKNSAIYERKVLKEYGWVPSKNPTTTITYPGMEPLTVGDVKLNRRQKRQMPKMLNQLTNKKDHSTRHRKGSKLEVRKDEDKDK
jgi:hypothetical protein